MSSLIVRQDFEASWLVRMAGSGLTLYGTINEEPDRKDLPASWATVDYESDGDRRVSLGGQGCWRETGIMQVVIFGASGTGEDTVIGFADQVRNAYRDWKDPTINLAILQADPGETGKSSSGNLFGAAVNLSYQYDRLID